MKRKRKWVGVLEYQDKNVRRRELKDFAFDPASTRGTISLIDIMEKRKCVFISATVLRKGHR